MRRLILLFAALSCFAQYTPAPHVFHTAALPSACAPGDVYHRSGDNTTWSCNTNGTTFTQLANGNGSSAFSVLTSGSNTSATMTVGTGASLAPVDSGVVNANQVNGGTVPASATALASDAGGKLVATTRTCISASFSNGNAALTAPLTVYAPAPAAGTLVSWTILAAGATGTNTVEVWKVASGTALPTVADSINTSGVSLTTGTAIHSTDLTDFTATAIAANDFIGVSLTAVDGTATYLNFAGFCQ